ncbi:DUF5131 family protein [Nocardia sp. CA-120079]|uniref:DUF5131 family protein n=1 Tax=Nocardia sp. CA-120079 TaxID=3239974 RepID=UPI003D956D09
MTGIEWTNQTWNPVTGCDRISAGCDHCYALAMAKRLKAMGVDKYQRDGDLRTSGPGFGVTMHPAALGIPLRWRTPRLVFVNSMADLFHARVDEDFVRDVFDVIRATPQHTYQVLTKRPLRARRMADKHLEFPPNLWLGVSVEDQDAADSRIPHLQAIPAAVRFLSCEPLLGPVDLDAHLFPDECAGGCGCRRPDDPDRHECGCGAGCADRRVAPALDWVIVGGESGPDARAMNPDWVRDLRDQCSDSGVPFFFKQWGGRHPKQLGRELDGRIWGQMPQSCPAISK